jgi:geranylgeranyl diphosphate synthase type II
MDNDTYRRGQLTFHAKYGQHSSYLMVYNLLSLIKKLILEDDDETLEYLELEEIINTELNNLVLGQKYDLDPDWIPLTGSRTLKISELKTASLFKLSTIGPYYLIKPKNTTIIAPDILLLLGYNLGMAFQLSDDFLDINIDNDTNNYGLETSEQELHSMFMKFHNSILFILKNKNIDKKSAFYQILDLMNKRFLKESK